MVSPLLSPPSPCPLPALLRTLALKDASYALPARSASCNQSKNTQKEFCAHETHAEEETSCLMNIQAGFRLTRVIHARGGEVVGLNPNIRIYRYSKGQYFDAHCKSQRQVVNLSLNNTSTAVDEFSACHCAKSYPPQSI